MEQRRYDISHYKNIDQIEHDGLSAFLNSQPSDGIHSFVANGRQIDVLIEIEGRRDDAALVFFPAAVSKTVETFPYFNGRNIAGRLKTKLIAFSDPALGVSRKVFTGWTLGDSEYQFHNDIPEIVQRIAGNARKIFTGISAGGFPALYFGNQFSDSLSFVVNPRTSIMNPPSHVFEAATYLYPNFDGHQISETIPTELDRVRNTVFYVQNHPDFKYVSSHMVPFMNKNLDSKNIYWRFGNWGDGHTRMPDTELTDAIRTIIDSPDWHSGALQAGGNKFSGMKDLLGEYGTLRLSS